MTGPGPSWPGIRFLLGPIPRGSDTNAELKRRLRLWEDGRFDELVWRVLGQQAETTRKSSSAAKVDQDEEKLGKRARVTTAAGAAGKALKGLVGGLAAGTAEERARWTASLIPRSALAAGPCTSHAAAACAFAWGGRDLRQAKLNMRQAG